ncbi:YheC/YheD family protein [Paenibacillus chibensis]|nr:YheC/YheD family protein [Paenibacillus chibensis]
MSKWIKTKLLMAHDDVRPVIPDTRKFSKSALKSMLGAYGMVYVKPDVGTFGKGVIRVEKRGAGGYSHQLGTKAFISRDIDTLYGSLAKLTGSKSYLIQKGIHLVKFNRRRFDIRVMVQLSPQGVWETTGLIGRVAHPGKIVTNYHSGGKPMDVKRLLGAHLHGKQMNRTIEKLEQLGVKVARHMHAKYPGFRQLGLDIGFDHTWTPWILEVNTNPDPYIFNQLSDKRMYRKVMRYRRAAQ